MTKFEIELDLGDYLIPLAETLEAFADGSVDPGDLVLLGDTIQRFGEYLEGVQENTEVELARLIEDKLDNWQVKIALITLASYIRSRA
jgi:hypothetical protein